MSTNRLDWHIVYKGFWSATHKDSDEPLVSATEEGLMRKINAFDKELRAKANNDS